MPRYLLGTQCFVDIAAGAGLPPQRWLESLDRGKVPARDVTISAVMPMILASAFTGALTPYQVALRQSCDDLIRRFVLGKRVVPVTKEIGDRWGILLDFHLTYVTRDNQIAEYDFRERLVMATAIEGIDGIPFTLVDKRQPAHTDLEPIGLQLADPYETHP